eukprot:9255130-Lingulodinium_polyedra.AAC.1
MPPPSGARGPNPGEVEIRTARPQTGQDRYWAAWARGDATPQLPSRWRLGGNSRLSRGPSRRRPTRPELGKASLLS